MKTVLYLGLDPPSSDNQVKYIHYPLIKVLPRPHYHPEVVFSFSLFPLYTHLVLTSKNSIQILFQLLPYFKINLSVLEKKNFICVGKRSAQQLDKFGTFTKLVAPEETSEGVVNLLLQNSFLPSYFFWPHSSLSRPIISEFFQQQNLKYHECVFYETILYQPGPKIDLHLVDEIFFTSPSTVEGFLKIYGFLPPHQKVRSIGPITSKKLQEVRDYQEEIVKN